MTKLINTPFADSGDKATIPQTDAAGNVNWAQGFPADYSKNPDTDPSAKRIERDDFNGLLNYITAAIREIQVNGTAPFITAADNGGSAFSYSAGAQVFYNKSSWIAIKDTTATPGNGDDWLNIGMPGRIVGLSTVTTVQDFKLNAATKSAIFIAVGGGGGGGGCRATSDNQMTCGQGGGGGGTVAFYVTGLNPGGVQETLAINIGTGGVGGGDSAAGGVGGETTITRAGVAIARAFGGSAGGSMGTSISQSGQITQQAGGEGGGFYLIPNTAAVTLLFTGKGGKAAPSLLTTQGNSISGTGGHSFFGEGGRGGTGQSGDGIGSETFGAGGGGSLSTGAGPARRGGGGKNGIVLVMELG